MGRRPQRAALWSFLLLAVALAALITVTTPWRVLPRPPGGPVLPDPHRDFVAVQIAREIAYHRWLWPAYLGEIAAVVLTSAWLGFTSTGARLVRRAARSVGGGRWARLLLGAVAVEVVIRLVSLPFAVWQERIQRSYGLSTRSWTAFGQDTTLQFGYTAGATVLGLAIFHALAHRFPHFWWAPGAVIGAALVATATFVYPYVVEPAFNHFTPMPAGPLRTSLLNLAATDHVHVSDVLVADASRRTNQLNAYVDGIGSGHRIVVYDTTLRVLPPAEIRMVIGHELGHVKHHDVARGTVEASLSAAAAVCLLFLLLQSRRLRERAGVRSAADPEALAVVLALVAVLGLATTPAQLVVTRRVEARADVHSLNLLRDPTTFITMQRRLSVANLADLDPNRLVVGFVYDHPSGPERIAYARTWAKLHDMTVPADQAAVPAGMGTSR